MSGCPVADIVSQSQGFWAIRLFGLSKLGHCVTRLSCIAEGAAGIPPGPVPPLVIMLLIDRFWTVTLGGEAVSSAAAGGRLGVMTGADSGTDPGTGFGVAAGCGAVVHHRAARVCRAGRPGAAGAGGALLLRR